LKKPIKAIFFIVLIIIELLAFKGNDTLNITLGWDKLNHGVAFMVLYILLSFASKRLNTTAKVLLLLVFAFQIEIVQYFLPYREFSLLDVVADMIGVGLGYLFWHTAGVKLVKQSDIV
jgi:VanZ family protein